MKIKLLFLLLTTVLLVRGQDGYVSKFPIPENDIKLTRIAQANQYMDKIGQKAAIMGYESGAFETWIWPWKVLRNFDLQFFTGSSTYPIYSKDIVNNITVTPEATVISYVYESFTVKEMIFVPNDETGVVILLDVYTTVPLSVVPGFLPVMQPQWPAGIGGQYSYWDDDVKAFVISESQQRGLFLCGSPLGQQMSAPPAHMFADNPLQFRIDVSKENSFKGFIPVIIAGAPVKTKYDSVKSLYKRILNTIPELFQKNYKYYDDLRKNTLNIHTPVEKINSAFEWGKVDLHNLIVNNPVLGKGLVAGYGLSGGGGRPGFAWFFGGDAFINSLAMNSLQDFSTVKDALLFTQKWQRQDNFPIRKKSPDEKNTEIGKMAHELSQSNGLIDWWNDYHYGYNHADTSPWYLVAMGDYFRSTGDIEFLKNSWNSVKQAYRWCISKDSNGDGLMDLKGAGLGVLEFGSLVNIHNDIYTQVLWVQGLKEMIKMAGVLNDADIKNEASGLLKICEPELEKLYWIDDLGFYSFGANQEGKQVREKSIYSSSALFFKALDRKRSVSTLQNFNTSEMMTGWGVRNLSNRSALYEPSNYNYGTVWPFTSFMIGTSEFNYDFNLQGYAILLNTAQNLFNYGLGVAPEVLCGDINNKLAEAYNNQGFSYTGFILPLLRGLFGLDVDAAANKIYLSPRFPADWNSAEINNIKCGKNIVSVSFTRDNDMIKYSIKNSGDTPVKIKLEPSFAPGIKVLTFKANGVDSYEVPTDTEKGEELYTSKFRIEFIPGKESSLELKLGLVPEIYLIDKNEQPGSVNSALVINRHEVHGKELTIYAEGIQGKEYKLGVRNSDLINKLSGGTLEDGVIRFTTGDDSSKGYASKVLKIEIK